MNISILALVVTTAIAAQDATPPPAEAPAETPPATEAPPAEVYAKFARTAGPVQWET